MRTFDVGPGFVRAKECPDCLHTKCGEDCNCNCDAARAEYEAAALRAEVEKLRGALRDMRRTHSYTGGIVLCDCVACGDVDAALEGR